MYNFISGIVDSIENNIIVVDCSGVGYNIFSTNACVKNCNVGGKVKIFTYLDVRENSLSLFGFENLQEKACFLKLVDINGIGSKMAILILSNISRQDLAIAIVKQDYSVLSKIKGVGKKTAERILFELRDKFDKSEVEERNLNNNKNNFSNSSIVIEAQAALQALGFKAKEAAQLVDLCDTTGKTAEEIVMMALRQKTL